MSDQIREDIKAYLDGELSVERAEEVRIALEADPQLRLEAEEMKNLTEHLKSTVRLPEVQGLDEALNRVRPKFAFPRWAAYAATAGIVIVFAAFLMPKMPKSFGAAPASEMAAATKSMPGTDRMMADPAPSAKSADMARPQDGFAGGGFSGKAEAQPQERSKADMEMDNGVSAYKAPATSVPPSIGTARDVIKNGDIEVQVTDVKTSSTGFSKYVQANGGYVESSNLTNDEQDPQASMTVRVPANRFEETMAYLRNLGKVISDGTSGQDVTAQIADTTARIRVMKAEEDQLVTLLSAARKIGEILEIKDRLNQVRQEVESLESQSKSLKSLAALSTINVTFSSKPKVNEEIKKDDWLGETWINAVNALQSVWKVIVQIGAYILAFAPLWIPAVALLWFLKAKAARPKS